MRAIGDNLTALINELDKVVGVFNSRSVSKGIRYFGWSAVSAVAGHVLEYNKSYLQKAMIVLFRDVVGIPSRTITGGWVHAAMHNSPIIAALFFAASGICVYYSYERFSSRISETIASALQVGRDYKLNITNAVADYFSKYDKTYFQNLTWLIDVLRIPVKLGIVSAIVGYVLEHNKSYLQKATILLLRDILHISAKAITGGWIHAAMHNSPIVAALLSAIGSICIYCLYKKFEAFQHKQAQRENELQQLKQEGVDHENKLKELENSKLTLEQNIIRLKEAVQELDNAIEKKHKKQQDDQAEIAKLQKQLKEEKKGSDDERCDLEAIIEKRNKEIKNGEEEIDELNDKLIQATEDLKASETKINQLKSELNHPKAFGQLGQGGGPGGNAQDSSVPNQESLGGLGGGFGFGGGQPGQGGSGGGSFDQGGPGGNSGVPSQGNFGGPGGSGGGGSGQGGQGGNSQGGNGGQGGSGQLSQGGGHGGNSVNNNNANPAGKKTGIPPTIKSSALAGDPANVDLKDPSAPKGPSMMKRGGPAPSSGGASKPLTEEEKEDFMTRKSRILNLIILLKNRIGDIEPPYKAAMEKKEKAESALVPDVPDPEKPDKKLVILDEEEVLAYEIMRDEAIIKLETEFNKIAVLLERFNNLKINDIENKLTNTTIKTINRTIINSSKENERKINQLAEDIKNERQCQKYLQENLREFEEKKKQITSLISTISKMVNDIEQPYKDLKARKDAADLIFRNVSADSPNDDRLEQLQQNLEAANQAFEKVNKIGMLLVYFDALKLKIILLKEGWTAKTIDEVLLNKTKEIEGDLNQFKQAIEQEPQCKPYLKAEYKVVINTPKSGGKEKIQFTDEQLQAEIAKKAPKVDRKARKNIAEAESICNEIEGVVKNKLDAMENAEKAMKTTEQLASKRSRLALVKELKLYKENLDIQKKQYARSPGKNQEAFDAFKTNPSNTPPFSNIFKVLSDIAIAEAAFKECANQLNELPKLENVDKVNDFLNDYQWLLDEIKKAIASADEIKDEVVLDAEKFKKELSDLRKNLHQRINEAEVDGIFELIEKYSVAEFIDQDNKDNIDDYRSQIGKANDEYNAEKFDELKQELIDFLRVLNEDEEIILVKMVTENKADEATKAKLLNIKIAVDILKEIESKINDNTDQSRVDLINAYRVVFNQQKNDYKADIFNELKQELVNFIDVWNEEEARQARLNNIQEADVILKKIESKIDDKMAQSLKDQIKQYRVIFNQKKNDYKADEFNEFKRELANFLKFPKKS